MKICRICLEDLSINDIDNIISYLHPSLDICRSCLNKFQPVFKKFILNGITGIYVYEYKDDIQNLLYKFKGCGDYALKDVFLSLYKRELRAMFKDFYLIPIPSSIESIEKRKYKHVNEIFSCLKLPFLEILEKKDNVKQTSLSRKKRWENRSNIVWNMTEVKEGLKLLLVDDVMTTGATLISAIEVVKRFKPKVIKILVMSKKVEIIR